MYVEGIIYCILGCIAQFQYSRVCISVVAALPAPFREDFLWLISSSLFNNMARVVVHTVENFYAGITE